MLPTKFQFIWLRGFRGEDYNVKSYRTTDDGRQTTNDGRQTTDKKDKRSSKHTYID